MFFLSCLLLLNMSREFYLDFFSLSDMVLEKKRDDNILYNMTKFHIQLIFFLVNSRWTISYSINIIKAKLDGVLN